MVCYMLKQAANLLKRTEGLVKLVVSNPGKRPTTPLGLEIDKKNVANKPGLKVSSRPSSRPATPAPGKCALEICPSQLC